MKLFDWSIMEPDPEELFMETPQVPQYLYYNKSNDTFEIYVHYIEHEDYEYKGELRHMIQKLADLRASNAKITKFFNETHTDIS